MTTTAARDVREILAERAALVTALTRLNAARLRLSQRVGGVEIEILAARRALDEAEARDRLLRAELDEGEARLDALDARLGELDREFAGAAGREG